jgi:hypothetical protein
MLINRAKNKPEEVVKSYTAFAKSMKNVFSDFEASFPKDLIGFFKGDLLYQTTPSEKNETYIFKPNVTTYYINKNSELGKQIGNSNVGVVVHRYIDENGVETPIKNLSEYNFITGKGLLIVPPVTVKAPPKINVAKIKSVLSSIKSNVSNIDSAMDSTKLRELKLSDLSQIMYKYTNSKSGDFTNFGKDFLRFVNADSTISATKKIKVEEYVNENKDAIQAVFDSVREIQEIKNDLIKQLDSQDSDVKATMGNFEGGEGYVLANPAGDIKLVNRSTFSAVNRATTR